MFWRSGGLKTVFFRGAETPQGTVGENFTLRMSAPSMRQKVSRICDFLKVKLLNMRTLALAKWGAGNPVLSAKQPETVENQRFGLIFWKSLRQVCANVKPSFRSAKKMKG